MGPMALPFSPLVDFDSYGRRVPANPSKAEEMHTFAAKAFRPEAKLQIGAIELRQAAVPPVPEKVKARAERGEIRFSSVSL